MAPATWCAQCGAAGQPERAIGVDLDGEPACGMHRVKPAIDLPAVIEIPPFVAEPIRSKVESAVPSQPQTTEQEEDDMAQIICSGFEGESCSEVLGDKNSSGKCTRHYARMIYRKTHPKKRPGGAASKPRPKSEEDILAVQPVVVPACAGQTEAPFVTLRLPLDKVEKLIALLL